MIEETLSKILAFTLIIATILGVASYIYYMVVCTKVQLKKLEKK